MMQALAILCFNHNEDNRSSSLKLFWKMDWSNIRRHYWLIWLVDVIVLWKAEMVATYTFKVHVRPLSRQSCENDNMTDTAQLTRSWFFILHQRHEMAPQPREASTLNYRGTCSKRHLHLHLCPKLAAIWLFSCWPARHASFSGLGCHFVPIAWDSRSLLNRISHGGANRRFNHFGNHGWLGQFGATNNVFHSSLILCSTNGMILIRGKAHLCPFGQRLDRASLFQGSIGQWKVQRAVRVHLWGE